MICVLLALPLGVVSAGHASADPPNMMPLPPPVAEAVDHAVPPPPIPRLRTIPPRARAAGFDHRTMELREAMLPSPTGDPMFDRWPADLEARAPGEVIATRDVTGAAGPVVTVPLRSATLIKFRSTDATDAAIYGTATLLIPRRASRSPMPLLVNNLPIDSLGAACTPGYTLAHGFSIATGITDLIPPTTQFALADGHAVLIPDHQGPRMAYAEPVLAGHVVLDAIRAAVQLKSPTLGRSRIALTGYSGGAIATHGASKLIGEYAPELTGRVVGAALGGVPADFRMLVGSMNANLATGLFHAATFGIARERTEILPLANRPARWLATSPLKNVCVIPEALAGGTFLPMQLMSKDPDPFRSPVAERIYEITRMSDRTSAIPLLIYQGTHEWWIPAAGARALYRQQCARGANAAYREIFGEHVTGALLGFPVALEWLNRRLNGEPAASECPR
ncbi:lipase [Gordonia jinghuaiqii]|uniref:Lipase n=2 Tax=Gordonia jinghuaiqii TaxID=2758710 RepID=A0A7D7RBN3_9ACTN|nr:lipase family protein [Gordonia jinghuaiqii]MCR5977523.1 lipase [Gordonia jinghuaiqii]QMT02210.1 lipase [Gordonia jinghuaiqii]